MITKYPLAFTSLILGVASFVHLFGLEKAVLAVILGGMAVRTMAPGQEQGRKYAVAGVILGSAYILILAVIAIHKGPGIWSLIGK